MADSVDPAPLDGTQTTTEQAATYRYNHLGQRASKTVGGTTTYFVYSSTDGQMIGEYTSSGTPVREYLYLQGERVATVNHTGGTPQVRYVANDHVGQARYAWNDAGTMMFERTQTPFGESMAEQSYAKVPLRFPGQYYDPESGMNQNWNRDYDPAIGGYLQPDRIGILKNFNHDPELQVAVKQLQIDTQSDIEGLNQPYTYVSSSPLDYIDPYGLFGKTVPGKPGGGHGPMGGMGRSLGDMFSGPNGTFHPGFSKQDWVCSLPNIHTSRWGDVGLGVIADNCVLERCKKHDQCYEDNKCNMSSWVSSILGGTKSCNQCNSDFFE